jgi:hypothetical protein
MSLNQCLKLIFSGFRSGQADAWIAALCVLASCLSVTAQAGPIKPSVLDSDDRAWFYNRVGVSSDESRRDRQECEVFGGMMVGSTATVPGPYGLVGDVIAAIASAGLKVAYVDDCMMSKGYRRFDLVGTRLRAFADRTAALPPEKLEAYFSADVPPEGVLGRHWSNSYWVAKAGEPPELSPRRFTPKAITVQTANDWKQPNWAKPVQAGAPLVAAGDQAILLIRLASSGGNARLGFDRRTAEGDAAFVQNGGHRQWPGIEPVIKTATKPQTFAFAVPSGIYSLAYFGISRKDYSTFCYGTLAFEAGPGQVIDLGDFTIEPGGMPVDPLSPEPGTRLRIDRPLMSPERLTEMGLDAPGAKAINPVLAEYYNLFPRKCQLFSRAYGLDIPGAPTWPARPGAEPQ